jgi:hypothetical protein
MEVQPLLCRWVPVELTKSSRFELDKRGRERFASLEVGRVNFVELATVATDLFWIVLERPPYEGLVTTKHTG